MTRYYWTGPSGVKHEVFGFAAGLVVLSVLLILFLPTLAAVALWYFAGVPGGLCVLLAIPTQFVWSFGVIKN